MKPQPYSPKRAKHLVPALCLGLGFLTACKPSKPPEPEPTPSPTPVVIPLPKPTPTPTIARKPMDTAVLFNGITYVQKIQAPQSEELASAERTNPSSYTVEIKVTVEKPRPATTAEDFQANDPTLAQTLSKIPGFPASASVSPAFEKLYELKTLWMRERLSRLDQLLTRHNFYDCETILAFSAPETNRSMLLLKGDMDVNVDGSDGDRNIEVDGSSKFFQPQTSYRWKKTTERRNQFLDATEDRLAAYKNEYAVKGLTAQRNAELKEGIETLSRRVYDLKTWSFLVSVSDPSIVLPGFMLRADGDQPAYAAIGDYAVVFYGGKGYPVIVGDAGPSFKFGEASMRLCKELNAGSSAMARPVSNLNVAYIVFPGTAEEPKAPDLAHWHKRCSELLAEVGMKDIELHQWEDIVQPWPTPTPTPQPEIPVQETPATSVDSTPPPALEPSTAPSPAPSADESPSPSPASETPIPQESPSPNPPATP